MSVYGAPFVPLALPPLPPGWTQHTAPTGHVYYYHTASKQSTYTRPVPSFAGQPTGGVPAVKKEKPLVKTPVPGTEWTRVKTTEGNIFYTHKASKTSVWTVPDDIKEEVENLERDEEETAAVQLAEDARKAEEERLLEVERIKDEVHEMVKRKAEDVPMDDVSISKKARVEHVDEDEDEDDESEEEEWQREAAAQLAAEAEEERKRVEEEKRQEEEATRIEEEANKKMQLNMPAKVDLSVDEAKALFKTLLREKDINPLHPWDTSLPLIISDPRYVLLSSVAARREAFDEYCKDRARELREKAVKDQKDMADPNEAFGRLLREEVKSTRTSWTEWRRTWKKDRRFYGWGRDDREREKRFREYLKELGEKKRFEAKKAESSFFALLKESGVATPGSAWKDVKRKVSHDPRYEAVGSSSLREELFATFLKAQSDPPSKLVQAMQDNPDAETFKAQESEADREKLRREKKERAVRDREEKVRVERSRLEADIGRSKMGLDKEEGERDFRTMLTDAIRDPQMTWDSALSQLSIDPRFTLSPLPTNQQLHLFHAHVAQLRARHLESLHALFESHAPSLATPFAELPLPSLLASLPVGKLGLDVHALEHTYTKWQRERTEAARVAFNQMMGENAFVEFWGRLSKMGGEGVNGGVKADEYGDEDEGEEGGGKADMKALAKNIDIRDVEKVLKNDKRYIMFDHVPEEREAWIRDYVSHLSAPRLSVHVGET